MSQPDQSYLPECGVSHRIDMVIPAQYRLPRFNSDFNSGFSHSFDCIARLGTLQAAHEFYPTLHDYWATRLGGQYGQE